MKLFISLLTILVIPTMGTVEKTKGGFFPSLEDLKLFKYYFTSSRSAGIRFISEIHFAPYTSFSIIALNTKLLHEKQSQLFDLEDCVSKVCSDIDWYKEGHQRHHFDEMNSNLSNQWKFATVFTAGNHLEISPSWQMFTQYLKSGNVALNKLKEHLTQYLPKRSIITYDLEVQNYKYSYHLYGQHDATRGFHGTTFTGFLEIRMKILYSQKFAEDTESGLRTALESLKNRPNQKTGIKRKVAELEAMIREGDFNRTSYFEFRVMRPIEIKNTTASLVRERYNIRFEDLGDNISAESIRNRWIFSFENRISLRDKDEPEDYIPAFFSCIGLSKKNNVEEVNSLLDEYFGISEPNAFISRPDTNKSSNGKGIRVVLLVLFLGLGIAIFLLGCYYIKKGKYFPKRVDKKRKRKKILS